MKPRKERQIPNKWFAGREWPGNIEDDDIAKEVLYRRIQGGMEGFWFLTESYWPKNAPRQFVRNPWSERMVEYACKTEFLGASGCGSSAKSSTFAVWALLTWLCNPEKTKVLVTSTSKIESRNRIWGYIRNYYSGGIKRMPGKLVDSMCKIMLDKDEDETADTMAGIELIAAAPNKEKEAVGRIIGIHNEHVILILDELPELSPAVLEAAYGNLICNPHFQVIGLGNFNSIYDPFGIFTTPKAGWANVHPDMDEWETVCNGLPGWCIRFDGIRSPNVLVGEDIFPFLYRNRDLERHKAGGENSPRFWRMCRSFPCQSGDEHTLMSESDFIAGKVHETVVWAGKPTRVAACDPAWTKDGDDCVLLFGSYGETIQGTWVLQFDSAELLRGDVRKIGDSIPIQRARLLVEAVQREKIAQENVGIEVSGGGANWAEIVSEMGLKRFHRVQFGGAPSEYAYSGEGTGKDKYANRVSEIWGRCAEMTRAGQIKGLIMEVAKDWESRQYENVKFSGGIRILVESKRDMKKRLGRSPDYGDAGGVMVDVVCEVLGATIGDMIGGAPKSEEDGTDWNTWAAGQHAIYKSRFDNRLLGVH